MQSLVVPYKAVKSNYMVGTVIIISILILFSPVAVTEMVTVYALNQGTNPFAPYMPASILSLLFCYTLDKCLSASGGGFVICINLVLFIIILNASKIVDGLHPNSSAVPFVTIFRPIQ
jgi:hypothetical protein